MDDRKPPSSWAERLKEYREAAANAPKAFSVLWEADRFGAICLGTIMAVSAVIPVAEAWVAKLIIDAVVAKAGLNAVLPYVAVELGLILLSSVLSQVRTLVEKLVDQRVGHLVTTRIIRKALSLETRYFEDPAFYDRMQKARRQSEYRIMGCVRGGFRLLSDALALASMLTILLAFQPWVALILFAAGIPSFVVQARYSQLSFRLDTWRTPEVRVMTYLEHLLTQDSSVKEVKLFGLGEPLLGRYTEIFGRVFREDAALARSRSIKSVLWGLLSTLVYYGAYVWIIHQTLTGRLTIGEMTFYMAMFSGSQGRFQSILAGIGDIYEDGLFLDNLFSFLGIKSQVDTLDQRARPLEDSTRGLEFEDVWFQYPGREDWALQGVSLTIGPQEKLALVGDNGAGKTTLIKLLTRLYEPTRGRVLFHGIDLRYYSPEELQRRIGAIFQDYVRYHLPLRENIGFGAVEKLGDQRRIEGAAAKSGADEVARALPKKYDSVLGRWFDDGTELSGGQWQKVALSRAFMGDREVLVLDEPTASLDAGAEYEIFRRFKDLTGGKIALLVSHRFSTVRMADRIAVLKAGKIEELGSHAELLARGGTYARLFELQAQGYR